MEFTFKYDILPFFLLTCIYFRRPFGEYLHLYKKMISARCYISYKCFELRLSVLVFHHKIPAQMGKISIWLNFIHYDLACFAAALTLINNKYRGSPRLLAQRCRAAGGLRCASRLGARVPRGHSSPVRVPRRERRGRRFVCGGERVWRAGMPLDKTTSSAVRYLKCEVQSSRARCNMLNKKRYCGPCIHTITSFN